MKVEALFFPLGITTNLRFNMPWKVRLAKEMRTQRSRERCVTMCAFSKLPLHKGSDLKAANAR